MHVQGESGRETCVVVDWSRRSDAAGDAGVWIDASPDVAGAVESPAVSRVDALDVRQSSVVAVRHASLVRRLQTRTAARCVHARSRQNPAQLSGA